MHFDGHQMMQGLNNYITLNNAFILRHQRLSSCKPGDAIYLSITVCVSTVLNFSLL